MAVAFEQVFNRCHGLPKKYDSTYRVLLEDPSAAVADKACAQECTFSRPMRGKSPGSTLSNYTASTLRDCQDHCEKDHKCVSVVFRESQGSCFTLPRLFDSNLEYSTDDAVLSNKVCKSKCKFSEPRLASSALRGCEKPGHALSWKACTDECAADSECRAVVYQQDLGVCHHLKQSYNAMLFLSTADAIAADKVCNEGPMPKALSLHQAPVDARILSAAAAVDESPEAIAGR